MRLIDADNLKRTLSASDNIPWLKGIPVTDVYINKQLGIDVGDISFDRLAEICEAEREGRLRILVRHSVPHNTKAYIYDHYDELQQGKIIHGKNAYAMRFICETTAFDISNYDIGRNVFLTREEAEKALAEMEDIK